MLRSGSSAMKLGVMCSGNGTNFENIIKTCWHDEVVLMIYNKEGCGAMKRAAKFGIPSCHIKSADETRIINEFKWAGVDVIVLAGWMRIISPKFVKEFPNRIINVHPSLLPKYKGLNVVQRAMEAGDSVTGCTVHYVNDELDGGEIIIQREVPINPEDTIKTLTRRIQLKEYSILPAALEIVKERLGINFC